PRTAYCFSPFDIAIINGRIGMRLVPPEAKKRELLFPLMNFLFNAGLHPERDSCKAMGSWYSALVYHGAIDCDHGMNLATDSDECEPRGCMLLPLGLQIA